MKNICGSCNGTGKNLSKKKCLHCFGMGFRAIRNKIEEIKKKLGSCND